MKVLFIGDITGSSGRKIVAEELKQLKDTHEVDLTIANVENAAHGIGVTPKIVRQLSEMGVDVMTGGNHLFDKKEIIDELVDFPYLLRGVNYFGEVPGNFSFTGKVGDTPYLVATFIGRTFMGTYDSPFHRFDSFIRDFDNIPVKIVDFHAEATSEKIAFARYVDGRVSALIGTHTHVQTADEQILPQGTAYISDVGMTGPHDGIIGMNTESVMPRFLTGLPTRFEPAEGKTKLHAVILDIDDVTGKAHSISRVSVDRMVSEEISEPDGNR